jgi:acylphosphatase
VGIIAEEFCQMIQPGDPSEADIVRRHIIVRGTVQGVGFRAFTLTVARELGITGWVRNQADGRSVEIVAVGSPEIVERFVAEVQRGPASAHVTGVDQTSFLTSESFTSFTVKH